MPTSCHSSLGATDHWAKDLAVKGSQPLPYTKHFQTLFKRKTKRGKSNGGKKPKRKWWIGAFVGCIVFLILVVALVSWVVKQRDTRRKSRLVSSAPIAAAARGSVPLTEGGSLAKA